MRGRMIGTLCGVTLLVLSGLSSDVRAAQARDDRVATAMVASLNGDVRVQTRTGQRSLQLFDRLYDGDTIRTGSGAEVVVVFRTGARTRVSGASEVRVRTDSLVARKGSVESLTAVPAVPLVAPVAGAGAAVTAVRIRAGNLRVTGPLHGETVIAEAVVLAYEPGGAESYDVEITSMDGTIVFREGTTDTHLVVPSSLLDPGVAYRWEVRARWTTGFEARTDGTFRTLPADAAKQRIALHAAVTGSDPDSLALLAEVDFALGLWRESLARFRAARAAGATDAVVNERVALLEQRVTPGPDEQTR